MPKLGRLPRCTLDPRKYTPLSAIINNEAEHVCIFPVHNDIAMNPKEQQRT